MKEGGREVWRKEEGQRVRKKGGGGGAICSSVFTFRLKSWREEVWRGGGVHGREDASDSRSRLRFNPQPRAGDRRKEARDRRGRVTSSKPATPVSCAGGREALETAERVVCVKTHTQTQSCRA